MKLDFHNKLTKTEDIEAEEALYKQLLFDNSSLLIVSDMDQLASSFTVGFLSPNDNISWEKSVKLYPDSSLENLLKSKLNAPVFIKVPLDWAKYGKLEEEKGQFYYNVPLNSILPICEIISYHIQNKDLEKINTLCFTYKVELEFEFIEDWVPSSPKRLKYFSASSPLFVDKIMGGILASCISEISGHLIDEKTISRSSKYIEPFTAYKLFHKKDQIIPKGTILGPQGYSLVLSLEHSISSNEILNLNKQEANLKKQILKKNPTATLIEDYCIDPSTQFLWLIPLVLQHLSSLEKGDALPFHKELKKVLKANKISATVENQWAYILFAGFSAYFISGNVWGNANELINQSFQFINLLKTSVSSPLFKKNDDDKSLVKVRKIGQKIIEYTKEGSSKKITELAHNFNKSISKGNLLDTILASLSILWSTSTASKDWYNVLNVAFNRDVENLAQIFPVLGTWAGFINGYKALRRKRNYDFINAQHLEKLAIKITKKIENPEIELNGLKNHESYYFDEYETSSNSNVLKVLQLNSGYKCPIAIPFKSKNSDALKLKEKELSNIKELIKQQQELEEGQIIIKKQLSFLIKNNNER